MEIIATCAMAGVEGVKRPRVLIVGAFPPLGYKVFGGIVTSCKALLDSSFSEKFELVLIDSTQVSNPPPGIFIRLMLAVRRFVRFVLALINARPDCVLIFASVGMGLVEKGAMAIVAKLLRIPVLMFPRGGEVLAKFDDSLFTRVVSKFALSHPQKVLCQGEQWQEFVVQKLRRDIDDAPIVRNWTATNALLAIGQQRTTHEAASTVKLLFVGWLDREKGVFELLQACAALSKKRDILLELVGEGNLSVSARDYVDKHGLVDRVVFRGWLTGEDLLSTYRNADIFVLPSWAEGLPNAMVEAMASGLAIVATEVGNIPSVIVDGENGLLVSSKDVFSLENALERLLADPGLRERMANRAYESAQKSFGVDAAIERLSAVIYSVTDCK